MKISFEQLFYGRGERGYGILGVSPGGNPFAPRVESLCGAVGTPSGDYGGEPFLLSVPEGDHVVMVCGRRGPPDAMGRSTLFFHALVANRAEMVYANTDAFSLFSQGMFADEMPSGEIASLDVDVKPSAATLPRDGTVAHVLLPCLFRAAAPAQKLVRVTVGDQARVLSWATFAFQSMRGFDIQVLPPRVSCSRDVNEYDLTGKLISPARETGNSRMEASQPRHPDERSYPSDRQVARVTPERNSSTMLKLSAIINIGLAIICAVLIISRKSKTFSPESTAPQIVVTNFVERVVEKHVVAPLSDEQRTAIEKTAIEQFRSELRDRFPKGKEVRDFDERVVELPKYEDICTDSKFVQQKVLLDKLKVYVDFVNQNLLKGKTQ